MRTVPIHTDYITLGQFLKLTDCIDSGGQAKPFLQETAIQVNGEAENRRGRKLVDGDLVQVDGFGEFRIARQG
ncbi:S4 domain-containing protein YaaA [Gorillibacterium sp. sgz500922]|uniref:S4 domain-containing protein YaaA n=1 Tax=Gorillibacterium sp. sgz500922 TaxID=3446694 RepID=UPI003F67656E